MLYHSVSSDNLVNTKSTSKTYILHGIEEGDFQDALSKFSSESLSMSMENLSIRRRVLQERTNAYTGKLNLFFIIRNGCGDGGSSIFFLFWQLGQGSVMLNII